MRVRRAALALTALAVLGSTAPAHAGVGVPLPTPPGGSSGTATGYAYDGMGGSSTYFHLNGSVRLGGVTHTGSFWIYDTGGLYESSDAFTRIGTCVIGDTVWLSLEAPAAAVMKCQGRYPGQTSSWVTTLIMPLPQVQPASYYHGQGYQYDGPYAG